MSYIFELDDELPATPFVDVAFSTEIVEFTLGYDVEVGIAVIMSVMLVPGASYLDGEVDEVFDLRFGIRERDAEHEWKVTAPDYTREAVNKYIPKEYRMDVLSLMCKAVQILVNNSTAKHLTMETYYANLPKEALKKYEETCNSVKACGFELQDQFRDEETGKNYWFLSSIPIESMASGDIVAEQEE